MFPFGKRKPLTATPAPVAKPKQNTALDDAKKRIRDMVRDADERTERVLERLRTREAKGNRCS